MLSPRHLRFPLYAAVAVVAVALMVWTNRGGNSLGKSVKSGGFDVAQSASEANAAKASTIQHANPAAPTIPSTKFVTASEVLPQLTQAVTDWRTYRPQKLTVSPYADLAMDFQVTSIRQENGRTIWQGRNALTGAFLVTVATQNDWHAVLEVPGASSFEFHISGQTASVTEKYEVGSCGTDALVAGADLAQNTVVLSPDPNSDTDVPDGDGPSGTAATKVDVLFFFDASTFAANQNSHPAIETAIAARVEAANLVLENSHIKNFRWNFVAAYQVPTYNVTGLLKDDLNAVTFTDNPTGQFVSDKCALHGVDQAVVFVSGDRDYAGTAWVPSGDDSLAHYAAVVWNTNYTVLAHELAHNFGCRHDRSTENASSSDGRISYGFRFDYNGSDTGTVMSYAPNRVPYFSNPEVGFHGIKLGVSEGETGAADNAHLLMEKALAMSAHREFAPAPIITAQPDSTTFRRGTSVNLSVSASGENLTYQWRKNGAAISGATSAIYSKSSASDDDVGSYDVVVANNAGSVISTSATVAVSADTVSNSASTSGQSQAQAGGGGGGAPSDWFFAALAIVGALRAFRRKN